MDGQLWVIPIVGAGFDSTVISAPLRNGHAGASLHANWAIEPFPVPSVIPTQSQSALVTDGIEFQTAALGTPSLLKQGYGRWEWRTFFCNGSPTGGMQLTVATQFGRWFDMWAEDPHSPHPAKILTYKKVEAWVKFRISGVIVSESSPVPSDLLSSITLSLSDDQSHRWEYPRQYLADIGLDSWFVAYLYADMTENEFLPWSTRNLRFNANFQGPVENLLDCQPRTTTVDVEWLAIRLSEMEIVENQT